MPPYNKTMKFFSERSAHNYKSEKTRLKFKNINHYILYLYPTFTKEINTCPFASSACKKACLVNCGRGALKNVIEARKNRTQKIATDFEQSCKQIIAEIASLTIYNKMSGGGNQFSGLTVLLIWIFLAFGIVQNLKILVLFFVNIPKTL